MKPENRIRLMIWAIIILAVMNITTIASVMLNRHKGNLQKTYPQISENESMRFSGRYFQEYLNLRPHQMEKFREFNPHYRQRVRDINLSLTEIRLMMLKEMSSNNADTLSLNMLSDSVGCLHADLKKLTYRYFMDFRNICEGQQQDKLEQLFGEMFATDNQPGQYGRGYQYGRGRGRNSINQ